MSIFIISMENDPHVDLVVEKLSRRNAELFRLNTDKANEYNITLKNDDACISQAGPEKKVIFVNSVESVWLRRRLVPKIIESIFPKYMSFITAEWQVFLENLYYTIPDYKWVNSPLMIEKARMKVLQLREAQSIGFNVPPFKFTNDATKVYEFLDTYERVIYKPLSGGFIDGKDNILVYTNIIDRDKITERENVVREISISPGIFQPYIEKDYELRITIVGKKVFTTKIDSQSSSRTQTDWRRYDFKNGDSQYKASEIPEKISEQCLMLLEKFSLNYGAIDMIVTPDGDYVFLELNPNGQWLWVERLTGLKISSAIADFLLEKVNQSQH